MDERCIHRKVCLTISGEFQHGSETPAYYHLPGSQLGFAPEVQAWRLLYGRVFLRPSRSMLSPNPADLSPQI